MACAVVSLLYRNVSNVNDKGLTLRRRVDALDDGFAGG
jgi:hypothetical protein